MRASTIAAVTLGALSGSTHFTYSGDTESSTDVREPGSSSVYYIEPASLHTNSAISPSMYPFGEGFYIQGKGLYRLEDFQLQDDVAASRTDANKDEYDKAKADGQVEADKSMLNNPGVHVVVVVVVLGLIYGWRLERRHTLANEIDEFERY